MDKRDDQDSIYRAPTSDTAVPPDGDNVGVFVGPRYDSYYQRVFARFDDGSSASWNWPAFFVAAFWLLYRKMWALALVYWFVMPAVLMLVALAVSSTQSHPLDRYLYVNIVYYGLYTIIAFIIMPIFANRLYYRHANKKISKVSAGIADPDQRRLEIARKGGTSNIVLVVLPIVLIAIIGILAAIAIPAYQDYTIRAQVSEGLSLAGGAKAAVTDYHVSKGEFPGNNETAGIPAAGDFGGNYVNAIRVEQGTIIVEYGQRAHPAIQGKYLVLEPYSDSLGIEWSCYSETIANKYLPALCRN